MKRARQMTLSDPRRNERYHAELRNREAVRDAFVGLILAAVLLVALLAATWGPACRRLQGGP